MRAALALLDPLKPPETPFSAREIDTILEAARQAARFAGWHQAVPRANRERRRHQSFPEATGEEIIDAVVGGDVRRWAQVASRALVIARDEGFQAHAGRPEVHTEAGAL